METKTMKNIKDIEGGFFEVDCKYIDVFTDFISNKMILIGDMRYDPIFKSYSVFCRKDKCTYIFSNTFNDYIKKQIKQIKIMKILKQ